MVINGKEITGLFSYDIDATYTQNDLVYKDKTLYVALTKVSGIDPSDSETSKGKYTIYLGDRFVGLDDFLNYEKTESTLNDKYIPASLLPTILNHYLTGVDGKGVIESINDDFTPDSRVTADEILIDENINHAIYAVDRNLGGLPVDLYSSNSERINSEKLILKQYTYKEKEFVNSVQVSKRVRVQELIDHSQYMVWYRYQKIDDIDSIPSQWKSITLNTTNIHDNLLRLANEYKSRIIALQDTLTNLRKNFRFKSLDVSNSRDNYFQIPNEYLGKYRMTVGVRILVGNGIYNIINFTINLNSTITKYESDGIYLNIEDNIIFLYEDKNMTIRHRKAIIDNVYVHEYYG